MPPKLEYTLEAVNKRLKEGRIKVSLLVRGNMIWMQATLPPKPRSDRPKPYQQKISLGVPANESGFKHAEKEARLLGSRLSLEEFNWSQYMDSDRLPENRTVKSWVEEFKRHYLETNSLKEITWIDAWHEIYRRLPQDEPVTEEVLLKLVFRTNRDTRVRRETCRKLQALSDFIGLKVDLVQYQGTYGESKVQPREIPSDEDIVRYWREIPNADWRWVYGVMAAFGLRDHEAFFCEWHEDGLFVTKGKTGSRLVFEALYPEWIDEFDLKNIRLPKIRNVDQVYESRKLGSKVSAQFKRFGVPFPPYALRHAFGIRSVHFGFHPTVAAALMGHTPDVHLKRYHKHINLTQNKEAAHRIMNRDDRPKPPIIPET
ncbi:MAG: integrase [Plectolyngbya sp. WJT66-NPBG17]|jgi:integrase|nr:integrase [Plectolyngbya sp. WJT66-NPBG17]